MLADRYDAVVVGVGGMGSAALYHLAKRGQKVSLPTVQHRAAQACQQLGLLPANGELAGEAEAVYVVQVLGLEQFEIAHDKGSSHGDSRIIRLAYHEHPDYVPLLLRAYELWQTLQKEADKASNCSS